MMKKKIFIIIFIIIFGILLFPKIETYEDGGTKTYTAVLYKYIRWSKMLQEKEGIEYIKPYYNEDELILFPNNFKNLDEYWKDENLEKVPKYKQKTKGKYEKVVGKNQENKNFKNKISNIVRSYDAGKFEGDKSLSFDNKKAEEIKNKIKLRSDNFYRNWEYPNKDFLKSKYTKNKPFLSINNEEGGQFYTIKKDGKETYKSSKTVFIVQDPLKNFLVEENNWWLLYNENDAKILKNNPGSDELTKTRLIHNGKEIENYKTFGLNKINEKIFYFFIEDKYSKINYYYNGKIYKTDFNEIIHDRCCEPGAYNIEFSTDGRIAFWGLKGEDFSYNELILPESNSGKILKSSKISEE